MRIGRPKKGEIKSWSYGLVACSLLGATLLISGLAYISGDDATSRSIQRAAKGDKDVAIGVVTRGRAQGHWHSTYHAAIS